MKLRGYFILACALIAMVMAGCSNDSTSTQEEKVTIVFNTDGGGEIASIEIDKGGTLPADYFGTESKAPAKQGSRFDGWKNGATAVSASTTFDDDATLTAQWVRQVTVNFSLGEGVAGTPPQPVVIDAGAALGSKYPAQIPRRDGWEFVGWYNGGTQYTSITVINTDAAAFTLTAQWSEEGEDQGPEYAQSPAIHPGNHFQEIEGGKERTAKVNVGFEANGLFSNIERGAGVLSSKWYRVTTTEADANAATVDNPTGTVIHTQTASSDTPHELSLPFTWLEEEAGVYWYYVIVTNTNVNATIRQTSSSITQNRLKVTVTE